MSDMQELIDKIILFFSEHKRKVITGLIAVTGLLFFVAPSHTDESDFDEYISQEALRRIRKNPSQMVKNDLKIAQMMVLEDKEVARPYMESYLNRIASFAPYHEKFLRITMIEDHNLAISEGEKLLETLKNEPEGREILYGYLLLELAGREHHLGNLEKEKSRIEESLSWLGKNPSKFAHFSNIGENGIKFLDFCKTRK